MKPKSLLALGAALGLMSSDLASEEISTAFLYQGYLTDGEGPANGLYELEFRL